MPDEAVHEIQLQGKQLVFLFMTATVVAVVIFLCGVMVGRGVRTHPAGESAVVASGVTEDPTAATVGPPTATAGSDAGSKPRDLEYTFGELGEDLPEETLEPVAAPVVPAAPPERPSRSAAASAPATAARVPSEPAGNGFVVQVAATRDRGEADMIARRLATKGYPAFVTTPGRGTPRMFRVRVGKYEDRREAETIARRLERQEQFKPWITN